MPLINNRFIFTRLTGVCIICWMFFSGCDGQSAADSKASTQTVLPTASNTSTSTPFVLPTREPSPTPVPELWISPALPTSFRDAFSPPSGWRIAENPDDAALRIGVGGEDVVSTWIYALVAPFPTIVDGVSEDDLRGVWAGTPAGPFSWLALLMDQDTLDVLSAKFGAPAENAVRVVETDRLTDEAWNGHPSWAIVPFEKLEPRWKVLEVDGISPMRKEFNADGYLLAVNIVLDGDPGLADQFAAAAGIPATNRDPSKLTFLVMTGVTAMVRATAWLMEEKGILYPAQDIAPILQSADITHISNEIPFVRDCPFPDPDPVSLHFCSDPRYIDLLEYVGADIIELTGNHLQDWGSDAMVYTLDLYRQRGWLYFGGGANLEDSRKAATIEHNGNRLAFIGCDAFYNDIAWATETEPGSAPCDLEYFKGEVRRLRDSNYLPIMTFQYYESYHYAPTPDQERDFRSMADAGAVIVSGSQAHSPQSFAFPDGSFVHYGLGNLFFDQYYLMPETRDAFIDRHVFYDGRYLGTELITIVFEDNAQSRLMTPGERSTLLQMVFSNSIW
jgi:poly-gamma-glutamate synthesis protein (capsule biosynthesis protein)